MRKKLMLDLVLIVTILLLFGCEMAEKGVKLQYKYKKGDVLKYKMYCISKETITPSGALYLEEGNDESPAKIETELECVITERVMEVKDNGEIISEITYDFWNLKYKMKAGEGVSFLMGLEEKEGLSFSSNLLEGKKIRIKKNKNGSLLQIENKDEILNQIYGQFSENDPEVIETLKKYDESIGNELIFPQKKMKIGAIWIEKKIFPISLICSMEGKFTYLIKEINPKVIEIIVEVTMKPKGGFLTEGLMKMQGMKVKHRGKGEGSGNIIFDYQNGRLISHKIKTNMEVYTSMGTVGEEEEIKASEIKMEYKTESVLELQ